VIKQLRDNIENCCFIGYQPLYSRGTSSGKIHVYAQRLIAGLEWNGTYLHRNGTGSGSSFVGWDSCFWERAGAVL